VTRERPPAGAGDVAEQEIQSRLASIGVGLWLSRIARRREAERTQYLWLSVMAQRKKAVDDGEDDE